jgi:multicomponent Na+:H+ antiporter subunit C
MPTLTLVLALLMAGPPQRVTPMTGAHALRPRERGDLSDCSRVRLTDRHRPVRADRATLHPLRKILAFNIMGGGVFLLFGAIARRGAGAGFGGDPVPQALLITGIVVAFSATALAVALLLRLNAKLPAIRRWPSRRRPTMTDPGQRA